MVRAMSDLVDRNRLALMRARATGDGMFLQDLAADELQDRLKMVNRSFTRPAIVTGFPGLWSERFPGATVVADDDFLDLAPGAHDLVIHALSLHWANDPVGQVVQCQRALAPDGLFLAATFGGRTLHELRSALAEAEAALTGGLSPRVLPMGELRDLGHLLQRAGLALPVADSLTREVTYHDTLALMHDLRAMGEGNAMRARAGYTARAVFAEAAQRYSQAFGKADGRIPATFEIVVLTGWAPHDSQQKPLRPGSATSRLAEALGTHEIKLPD